MEFRSENKLTEKQLSEKQLLEKQLTEKFLSELGKFLDSEGRLLLFPAKRRYKFMSLIYLAAKFEPEIIYTEKEVNAIIERYHVFQDKWLLRRELINHGFLNRLSDGSQYWLAKEQPVFDAELAAK